MSTPCRIQRKRTRGWRMPAGVVYVGRPTKWGNPFVTWQHPRRPEERAVLLTHRWTILKRFDADAGDEVHYFEQWVLGLLPELRGLKEFTDRARDIRASLSELAGRDLACWCRLDRRCHADVYLRLANENQGGT